MNSICEYLCRIKNSGVSMVLDFGRSRRGAWEENFEIFIAIARNPAKPDGDNL